MKRMNNGLGEIRIQAITGRWPWPDNYPELIFFEDRRFCLASWAWPYSGVAAQYREDRPENSAHLLVLSDGTYRIDHLDEANPDHGRVGQHFFRDTPFGKALSTGYGQFALGALGGFVAVLGVAAIGSTGR